MLGLLGSAYRELSAALGLQTQHQGCLLYTSCFYHREDLEHIRLHVLQKR